jgi:hypothetical protein
LNIINDLEDALGVFFSFKSSIKTPYYYSYIPTLVLLGFVVRMLDFDSVRQPQKVEFSCVENASATTRFGHPACLGGNGAALTSLGCAVIIP